MSLRRTGLPLRRWYRIDNVAGTISIRGKGGKFKGRKKVKGLGDKTTVRRMKKAVDYNRDGIIDFPKGGIVGRNSRPRGGRMVIVRASSRAIGHRRGM